MIAVLLVGGRGTPWGAAVYSSAWSRRKGPRSRSSSAALGGMVVRRRDGTSVRLCQELCHVQTSVISAALQGGRVGSLTGEEREAGKVYVT